MPDLKPTGSAASTPASLAEWLAVLERRHPQTIELGLERIRAVWQRMGAPALANRVITVAGTNGKGSTCAYLASMVQALGYRQACYSSPHLLHYNERLRVQGVMVSDAAWVRAFEQVEAALQGVSLSYFEFGTLAAFYHMASQQLDFAILEVGLGGRLDAVNLVDADCAVITSVGLDHQEYLGPDRESIGREKAGIMRPDTPVVCSEAQPPDSVVQQAAQLNAPLYRPGQGFEVLPRQQGFIWKHADLQVEIPSLPMIGPHQQQNLAAAIMVLAVLLPNDFLRSSAWLDGMKATRLAGRMQQLWCKPAVWVDVGHNALAASAIAAALPGLYPGPVNCVLGMLRDKDAAAVTAALDGHVRHWYCASLTGERGRSGDELMQQVATMAAGGKATAYSDVPQALKKAMQDAGEAGAALVFGSFVTAAQAAQFLSRGNTQNELPGLLLESQLNEETG